MGLKRWYISNFPASGTDYLLVGGTPDQDTVIISMQIYNDSNDLANIELRFADDSETQCNWVITKAVGESPTVIDSVIVIEPDDKVWCRSDQVNCSIRANGEVR